MWRGILLYLDGMKLAGSCHIEMLEKVSQYVLVEVTLVPLKTGMLAKTWKPIPHEEKKIILPLMKYSGLPSVFFFLLKSLPPKNLFQLEITHSESEILWGEQN